MSGITKALPAVAGALAGGAVALAIASGSGGTTTTVTTTLLSSGRGSSVPTSLSSTQGETVNQIYRKASPGVVDITVLSQQQNSGFGFFGQNGGTQQTEGEGAGVVYDSSGDILTDEHVVANATSVKVHFQDGHTYTAKVLGTDPSTDIAVIHVDAPASELHPIPFANSNDAQVGDPVVAIGSPFSLPETTTAGIVSATHRSIQAPNNFTILNAIQTDAAINPGNSGGPLLDASGKVLGLNDQIQTNSGSSAGVGFATPANDDVRIANAIIAGHPVQHAYVGICLQPTNAGQAEVATSPSQTCQNPVAPNSPAADAGLEPGDVITAIDATAISSPDSFITRIDTYSPGQTVKLTIKRGGQVKQISVKLAPRPTRAGAG